MHSMTDMFGRRRDRVVRRDGLVSDHIYLGAADLRNPQRIDDRAVVDEPRDKAMMSGRLAFISRYLQRVVDLG